MWMPVRSSAHGSFGACLIAVRAFGPWRLAWLAESVYANRGATCGRTEPRTTAPARGSCSCLGPLPRSETEWGRLGGGRSYQRHPERSDGETRGLNQEPVGHAPNQQLIVGHRLVHGHLRATIVVKSSFRHACCWWAAPTPNPSHYAPKTPLRRRGTGGADCRLPTADCRLPSSSPTTGAPRGRPGRRSPASWVQRR
jgi:hypothetical protein